MERIKTKQNFIKHQFRPVNPAFVKERVKGMRSIGRTPDGENLKEQDAGRNIVD